mgnify:CR=1 FL=1
MDKMELKALGKINLGLDVLGRRENGYHDVRMVMQTVYLYDQIRIEKTKKPGIELSTNLFYLPVNENNLAYQAADLLMKEFDVKEGVKITLINTYRWQQEWQEEARMQRQFCSGLTVCFHLVFHRKN